MCFAHIINICCQHVIATFTDIELADAAEDFVTALPPGHPNQQSFEEALRWDPVALGHYIACVIQNMGQWHEAFNNLIQDGNEKGWFVVGDLHPLNCHCDNFYVILSQDGILSTTWFSIYVRCVQYV